MDGEQLEKASRIYAKIPCYKANVFDKDLKAYVPNPLPRPDMEPFYAMGLLRPENLVHGKYYVGDCRNATVARWNAKDLCFRHVRHKFGNAFEEDINHPAHDVGWDIFAAVAEVEPCEAEKVTGGFEDVDQK